MSGRLSLALSEQIRNMTSWILTDSHPVDSRKNESIDESKDLKKETRENNPTEVIPGGTLIAEASQPQSNIVAPSVHSHLTSLTSETLEMPSVSSVSAEHDVPPFVSETFDKFEHHHSVASELKVPIIQPNLNAAPSSAVHIEEETDKLGKLKLKLIEEGDISNSNLIFRDSVRKELYTINESSLEQLDSLEPLSSCATLQKGSLEPLPTGHDMCLFSL